MKSLTPNAVRVVECYDDGTDARHYRFESVARCVMLTPEPGQFFMLSVPGHGEAPFTYVTPPDDSGHFTALVRAVGGLTRALATLDTGAVLGARGPFGRGWPLAELRGRRVLLIAGGCGLAPLAALLDRLIESRDGTRVALI
jgi:NAD(P)H-flavin reductase